MKILIVFAIVCLRSFIVFSQTYTTTSQGKNIGNGGAYVAPVVTKTYTVRPPVYTPPARSSTGASSSNSSSTGSSSAGSSRSGGSSNTGSTYTPSGKPANPTTAADYHDMGLTKYSANQYEAAIAYFQKAVELDPRDAQSYLLIGLSKYKLKDFEGSIQPFNKTIELVPKHDIAHISRADSKLMMEDFEGAFEDYTKSIALYNSGYASTYYSRGIARYNTKDFKGAIEDYTKAIDLCDETQKAWDAEHEKEFSKLSSKARKEAMDKEGRAIEREPMYAGAFAKRGSAKMQLRNVQGALLDYSRSIEINPKNAESYYIRGILNLTIPGNKEAGCSDLKRAEDLGYATASNVIKTYCR